MEKSAQNQTIHFFEKSKNILILPSSPPDGDSVGSAIALYLVLKKLKKEVTVVCADPVPEVFQFLPGEKIIQNQFSAKRDFIITVDCSDTDIEHIEHKVENGKVNIVLTPKKGDLSKRNVTFNHGDVMYDLVIVVDAGDIEQLGKLYEDHTDFFFQIPVINIDHHASNSEFGKVNLIDVMASSTTEMLYDLFQMMEKGQPLIDPEIATALLAGIITDTGSFQNANTTPKALQVAAELVDRGAAQQEIIKNVYKTKHLSTLRLWGKILDNIKVDEKHRIVWSTLTKNNFRETESTPNETGNIIDELLTNVPNIDIVLLLKEKENLVGGSLRTTSDMVNASKIAEMFGGGGHVRAAGFRIMGKNIKSVEEEVIKKIREYQKERLNMMEESEENLPAAEVSIEPIAQSSKPESLPEPMSAAKQASETALKQANVTSSELISEPVSKEMPVQTPPSESKPAPEQKQSSTAIDEATFMYDAMPAPESTSTSNSTPQPAFEPTLKPETKKAPEAIPEAILDLVSEQKSLPASEQTPAAIDEAELLHESIQESVQEPIPAADAIPVTIASSEQESEPSPSEQEPTSTTINDEAALIYEPIRESAPNQEAAAAPEQMPAVDATIVQKSISEQEQSSTAIDEATLMYEPMPTAPESTPTGDTMPIQTEETPIKTPSQAAVPEPAPASEQIFEPTLNPAANVESAPASKPAPIEPRIDLSKSKIFGADPANWEEKFSTKLPKNPYEEVAKKKKKS